MTTKEWVFMTVEEFCAQKMLENPPEKECERCKDKHQFWVEDFDGTVCIECAHDIYSEYMHQYEEWQNSQLYGWHR